MLVIDLPSFEIPKKLIIACNAVHSKCKASFKKTAKDPPSFRKGKRGLWDRAERIGRKSEKIDKNMWIIKRRQD